MAVAPDPEPFRSICVKKGLLTVQQANEVVKLQRHVAETLDLSHEFLEICLQKKLLNENEISTVHEAAQKDQRRSGRPLDAGRIRELAGFQIIEKIGVGAMGAVYKAHQKSLDRIVAIKILPPSLAENKLFVERFFREARASATLNHPNIVQGIDVGAAKGLHYFVMEFIDGETVGQRFKREGPLPLDDVLEIGRQTAQALEHAHKKGLIHRDVKPDNLMFSKVGARQGGFLIKVMDLGLARAMQEPDAGVTQPGTAVGTPFYISPEQARGESDLTGACDLYSLGCSLLHILTGRPPFDGETSASVMAKHLTNPPPNPKALKPDMPSAVAAILLKLMAKKPEERYPHAAALAEDLERVIKGERPEHVTLPKGKGKSTGPMRPVTIRAGKPVTTRSRPISRRFTSAVDDDSDIPLPPNRLTPKSKPFPTVSLAAAAVVVMVVAAALLSDSGKVRDPGKNESAQASKASANLATKREDHRSQENGQDATSSSPAPPSSPDKERLEALHRQALAAAERAPSNFSEQRSAWTLLKDAAGNGVWAKTAQSKLDELAEKEKQNASDDAAAIIKDAMALALERNFDTALSRLRSNPALLLRADAGAMLKSAEEKVIEQGEAFLKEQLSRGEALIASGDIRTAQEHYASLSKSKYKALAEDAAAKLPSLESVLIAARNEEESRAANALEALLKQVHPLVADKKLTEARNQLEEALVDKKLTPFVPVLELMCAGADQPYQALTALISKRLTRQDAAPSEAGPQIDLLGRNYRRLSGEGDAAKLEYALPNRPPQPLLSTPLASLSWRLLTRLAGFKENSIEVANPLPLDKKRALAGFLALAGETAIADQIFMGALQAEEKAPEALLAGWRRVIGTLNGFVCDYSVAKALADARKHANNDAWLDAEQALKELFIDNDREVTLTRTQLDEIRKMAEEVDAALMETELKNVKIADLFQGKATMGAQKSVELAYTFSDPQQLKDFIITGPAWEIEKNRLINACTGEYGQIWLNVKFEGQYLMVELAGGAPCELACRLAPEITSDRDAGLAFHFGRNGNEYSELWASQKSLSRIPDKLRPEGEDNAIKVLYNQNKVFGQLNGCKKNLEGSVIGQAPPHYVGLVTGGRKASIKELKVTGRLDSDWLATARKNACHSRRLGMPGGLARLSAGNHLKGVYEVDEDLTARLKYDFSDSMQLDDFQIRGAGRPEIRDGVLTSPPGKDLGDGNWSDRDGSWVIHRLPATPPFTCSFVVKPGRSASRLYWAHADLYHAGRKAKPYIHIEVVYENQIKLFLGGEGEKEMGSCRTRSTLHGKQIDLTFDGQKWFVEAEGKVVITCDMAGAFQPTDYGWAIPMGGDSCVDAFGITTWLNEKKEKPTPVELLANQAEPAPDPKTHLDSGSRENANECNKEASQGESVGVVKKENDKIPTTMQRLPYQFLSSFPLSAKSRGYNFKEKRLSGIYTLRITAAGLWNDGTANLWVGPEGGEKKLGAYPAMALLANMGEAGTVVIGKEWTGKLDLSQLIVFGPNDPIESRNDNQGEMKVVIEVLQK